MAGCTSYSTIVGPIVNSKMSPITDATTTTQSRIVRNQGHPNPRITSLFFHRKSTPKARQVEWPVPRSVDSPV